MTPLPPAMPVYPDTLATHAPLPRLGVFCAHAALKPEPARKAR